MLRNTPNPLPGVPLVESPFFDWFFDEEADPVLFRIATDLREKGYAVIDFPDEDFAERSARIIESMSPRYNWDAWKQGVTDGLRLQDTWRWNDDARAIATNPEILKLLGKLYGREAFAFQTLNFPVGTQQHYHTDSVHFSSIPERFMCGVWVALEDIHADAGPLLYYPGSHKLPIYVNEHIGKSYDPTAGATQDVYEEMWSHLVEQLDLKPERLLAKKGQALIWAANLMHGGDVHNDKSRTRWSQVTHYYFKGCSYFTPMASDPAMGRVTFREPQCLSSGQSMVNEYCGETVSKEFIDVVDPRKVAHRLLPEGFDPAAYLEANPDVMESGTPAEEHYIKYGRTEGRRLRLEPVSD